MGRANDYFANDERLDRFDGQIMMDVDAEEDRLTADGRQDHESSTQSKEVLFRISPGLFKKGNADGLGYDIEGCGVKIKVKTLSAHGESFAISRDYQVWENKHENNPPSAGPAFLSGYVA